MAAAAAVLAVLIARRTADGDAGPPTRMRDFARQPHAPIVALAVNAVQQNGVVIV